MQLTLGRSNYTEILCGQIYPFRTLECGIVLLDVLVVILLFNSYLFLLVRNAFSILFVPQISKYLNWSVCISSSVLCQNAQYLTISKVALSLY